jgi:hypothetical protein
LVAWSTSCADATGGGGGATGGGDGMLGMKHIVISSLTMFFDVIVHHPLHPVAHGQSAQYCRVRLQLHVVAYDYAWLLQQKDQHVGKVWLLKFDACLLLPSQ